MKKLISTLFVFAITLTSFSQVTVFSENFEGVVSMTSSSTSGTAPLWATNSTYFYQGTKSYTNIVNLNDTVFLTSTPFNTTGNSFVLLEFSHICKIDFSDFALIRVSNNNGATWTTLSGTQYMGSSGGFAGSGSFNDASYGNWFNPLSNSLWQREGFDVSSILGNSSNCLIRFVLKDGDANGANGKPGWFLDSIKVSMAPCEIFPPSNTVLPDPVIYQGNVYNTGPYNITVEAKDNSGIDTVKLTYSINALPPITVGMTMIAPDTFTYQIPSLTVGDSVTYSVEAIDASACANSTVNNMYGPSQIRYFKVFPTAPSGCQGTPVFTYPYIENFDSFVMGSESQTNPGTFVNNWYQGQNGTQDSRQWVVGTGTTPSSFGGSTGPSADNTSGSGRYLYYEVNGTSNNDSAFAYSNCFDISSLSNPSIEFYYNMNGAQIGELHLDILDGSTIIRDIMPPFIGDQGTGTGWFKKEVDISAYGPIVQFRFRVKGIGCCNGDIAIDDVKVFDKLPIDAGVTAVIRPVNFSTAAFMDTVEVTIRNNGATTITNMNISYSVNGSLVSTEPWVGSLPSLASVNYQFITPYSVPLGMHAICAWTSLVGDGDNSNDTICIQITGLRYDTITFESNFDSDTTFLAVNSPGPQGNIDWELGVPNYGNTNSAFSTPNAWDIELNNGYANNTGLGGSAEQSFLYSQFFNLTNSTNTRLRFKQNRFMYTFGDGCYLQYSVNGGSTWTTLGILNDPQGVNWYNYNFVTNAGPGWNGTSNGWINCEYNCSFLDGLPKVQFRFVFQRGTTNTLSNRDGISIDNFELIDPLKQDIAPIGLASPKTNCFLSGNDTVQVELRNEGDSAISNIPVTVELNGVILGTENVTATILPNQTYIHKFTTFTANLAAYGKYGFKIWTSHINDMRLKNDTLLADSVENVEGCFLTVEIRSGGFAYTGTNYYWRLTDIATNTIIDQKFLNSTDYPFLNTTYQELYCLKNGQNVNFYLNGSNFYFPTYSVFGYDTIYASGTPSASPPIDQNIAMGCPKVNTVEPTSLSPKGNSPLPVPQAYDIYSSFKNDGVIDNYNTIMICEIDGLFFDQDTITISGGAKYGAVIPMIFSKKWNPLPGCHDIKVYSRLPNGNPDDNPFTDTLLLKYCIIDSTNVNTTYCNDFETPGLWDFLPLNTKGNTLNGLWQKGTPSGNVINSSNTSPNCWKTDLDSTYGKSDYASLYTPIFNIDTGICYKLSFAQFFDTYENVDGGYVEYSLDKGFSWYLLGTYNDTNGTNWNTSSYITGSQNNNFPGFSGKSGGWINSDIKMAFNVPDNVMFRFTFDSDASTTPGVNGDGEGWAIDNVCFESIGKCSLNNIPNAIEENTKLALLLGQSYPNPSNGNTTIKYVLPAAGNTTFKVLNMLGEVVYIEEGERSAGVHQVNINVADWTNGIYFYSLTFDNEIQSKKLIVTK